MIAEEVVAQPLTTATNTELVDSVRKFLYEFTEDVAVTAEKSIRAWHQIVRLIRGTE